MAQNEMILRFRSISQNEAFARVTAGAFATQLNPTIGELSDIKTAVSEAVTNAIVHGYGNGDGMIELRAQLGDSVVTLEIIDEGKGIEDIEQARLPFFTTCPEQDRSGMGFTVMETFMDSLEVDSAPGRGTRVRMTKKVGAPMDGMGDRLRISDLGRKLRAYPLDASGLDEMGKDGFAAEPDESDGAFDALTIAEKNGGCL